MDVSYQEIQLKKRHILIQAKLGVQWRPSPGIVNLTTTSKGANHVSLRRK